MRAKVRRTLVVGAVLLAALVPATAGAQTDPTRPTQPVAVAPQPVAGDPAAPQVGTRGPGIAVTPSPNPPAAPRRLTPTTIARPAGVPASAAGLPLASGTGRRIVYANRAQRVWLVEADGSVAKTHRVSGRIGEPPPGTYAVYSKARYTYSMLNPLIRWGYMVRFFRTASGNNIGFHEIPTGPNGRLQSDAQLGLPLSSGCVRQSTPDAIFLWNWAPVGTKVVVLP